jgi:hypothetical protein
MMGRGATGCSLSHLPLRYSLEEVYRLMPGKVMIKCQVEKLE